MLYTSSIEKPHASKPEAWATRKFKGWGTGIERRTRLILGGRKEKQIPRFARDDTNGDWGVVAVSCGPGNMARR